MKTKILDCTLRDGGYYTNWDFDWKIVKSYLEAFNELPVDYLEIGYRNPILDGYYGEYFYCPKPTLDRIKEVAKKPLAIILDEKNINVDDVQSLLAPCLGVVAMIRMAIDPQNFERALGVAKEIKKMGFTLAFNVMYMSDWDRYPEMMDLLPKTEGLVDYFYMVDSYGGVYPDDVRRIIKSVKERTTVKLGFHGHNNLEMALANTLTAIEEGVDIIDATVTGMGRGAGNLKTELLLTALNSRGDIEVDYNALSKTTDEFVQLQREYEWGTNLPYMVSGANSLPQKEVMEWVSKRFYSFNSIIRALNNQSVGIKDNTSLTKYAPDKKFKNILIVGGGSSVEKHKENILNFINALDEVLIVHASSRNVPHIGKANHEQVHCLSGNEGYRLENIFNALNADNRKALLPPHPRKMGTYIPQALEDVAYELGKIDFTDKYKDSITAVVLQLVILHNPANVFVIGYDGYGGNVSKQHLELFQENSFLFNAFNEQNINALVALLPTGYSELKEDSLYKKI